MIDYKKLIKTLDSGWIAARTAAQLLPHDNIICDWGAEIEELFEALIGHVRTLEEKNR